MQKRFLALVFSLFLAFGCAYTSVDKGGDVKQYAFGQAETTHGECAYPDEGTPEGEATIDGANCTRSSGGALSDTIGGVFGQLTDVLKGFLPAGFSS